jgi:hypothetical protein
MSEETRKKLAALSFTEKIKLLEQLRDRSLAIIKARKKMVSRKKKQ